MSKLHFKITRRLAILIAFCALTAYAGLANAQGGPQFNCEQFTATLAQHESANRAYSQSVFSWWTTKKTWYAVGSDETLGTLATTSVTLHESAQGVFQSGNCPTPDTTAPVLTLIGDDTIEISQFSEFVDPGAQASDDRDGDITSLVVVSGTVDAEVVGTYELTYRVTDAAGNQATPIVRTVVVTQAAACQEFTSTVTLHEQAGRAYSESTASWWTQTKTWYAQGSNNNLGTVKTATKTLREIPAGSGSFELGACPAAPVPPVIDSVSVSVVGSNLTVTGSASDANGDLQAIILYTSGGGFECNVDSPIGTIGTIAYDCSDMSNWSFEQSGLNAGVYDCQESNGCVAVNAYDSEMQSSGMEYLSFTIYDVQPPVVTAVDTSVVGTTLTVTGSSAPGDNPLKSVVLYFPGGGVACDVDSPIGTVSQFTYDCSDMSNWSFVVTDMDVGVYDCQGSNSCMAVKAADSEMNDSALEYLSFTVTGETTPACFTAVNTAHAQAQRAVLMYNVLYYSVGGNDYLGLGTDSTSLSLDAAGVWKKVSRCPN